MLNVAVVGLGWWGRTIVSLLAGNRRLRVVMGVDVQPTSLGVPVKSAYEAALRDPAVQGVILCTPHSQHAGQVVQAAEAKKHVFCEKPLALSLQEALSSIKACNDNRVVLAVGHEKRFEPPVREVFRMAKMGELGTLLQVEANFSQNKFLSLPRSNWRLSEKEAPAGPMTATGIHLLDLSVGLLGPAATAYASVKTLGSGLANGDTLGALVSFHSGANALISAILATPFEGRFAVYGTKGWVEVRDKAHPEAPQGWILRKHGGESTDYPPANAVLANLEAFADAAEGRGPYPVPQQQMIANIAALEAVFASARSGKVEAVQ
ncbi:MAG TPA: Gfo/Idh/MocA family oxidoreductase [Burkholderiales bacterium]|nr:Gfo/Idh/MocA family oxidoreductase [Burkholderiales bacterium]